jgi:hypothetical protein
MDFSFTKQDSINRLFKNAEDNSNTNQPQNYISDNLGTSKI